MRRFNLFLLVFLITLSSCNNWGNSSKPIYLSEKSIRLLALDSSIIVSKNWSNSADNFFNEDMVIKICGESAMKMNQGWLTAAYTSSSSLLKSVPKSDSAYFQSLFHHFIIANEVDSLAECRRLLYLLGDSVNAGMTWQWQQSYMWMRYHARTWNVSQYQTQKSLLLQILKEQPNRLIESAITYEQLGNYESNLRNTKDAYLFYQNAIAYYNKLGWNRRKYLCLIRFADELLIQGNKNRALTVFGQIPDVSKIWPEVHCRKLLFLSELAYLSQDRLEEQIHLKQLSNYAIKNSLLFWAAEAATRMSSWHLEGNSNKNKDSVLHYANLTYQFAIDLQDKNLMANACIDLSMAESLLGNTDRAIRFAIDNLLLRKLQQHLSEEVRAYCRIASLFVLKKDFSSAKLYNDSALQILEAFPDERPFLSEVYQQRAKIESLVENYELAYFFRKKQFYWQSEGKRLAKTGNDVAQIRQFQSQLFQLSEQLAQNQNSLISFKRADRYLLLVALFCATMFVLLVFGKWQVLQQKFHKEFEEFELQKFQLGSIRKDFIDEFNITKWNAFELGLQLYQHLYETWRNHQLVDTQKRLQLWLKTLKSWLQK